MARGGGGRACAPHDCLAVTVMAGSGGDPEGPLRRLGTLPVSTVYLVHRQGRGSPPRGARLQAKGRTAD